MTAVPASRRRPTKHDAMTCRRCMIARAVSAVRDSLLTRIRRKPTHPHRRHKFTWREVRGNIVGSPWLGSVASCEYIPQPNRPGSQSTEIASELQRIKTV